MEDLKKVKSCLVEVDGCFDKIIDKESIKKTTKAEYEDAKKTIHHLINAMTNNLSRHLIEESFEKLKQAKTKKDILAVISDVVVEYMKYNQDSKKKDESDITPDIIKNHLKPLLESNPSLIISLFIKRIVHAHYVGIFARINDAKAREIMKVARKDIKNGMKLVGDSFPKNAHNTGFYEVAEQMFIYNLELALSRNLKHLCWENCKNASPNQCPKIKDELKKRIDEYPFITDGYQKYNEHGELTDFCVLNCENYIHNNRQPVPFFTLKFTNEDLYDGYMQLIRK